LVLKATIEALTITISRTLGHADSCQPLGAVFADSGWSKRLNDRKMNQMRGERESAGRDRNAAR
jgi:hypothetical protein